MSFKIPGSTDTSFPVRSIDIQVYSGISIYLLSVWQCLAKCISLFPFSSDPCDPRLIFTQELHPLKTLYNYICCI